MNLRGTAAPEIETSLDSGDGVDTEPVPVLDETTKQLICLAASAADFKSGEDTVVMDMVELLCVVDAFVITSGRNPRQVRTIVEEVERVIKEHTGSAPRAIEGLADATWVLMDYGDFIVHVFLDENRTYYDLEHLWSSAPRLDWREHVKVAP